MFFFFVCGEHTFTKEVPGYEGVICQCHNCGNMSGRIIKRRPFFTLCWIPIIPFTISGYDDIVCHICRFNEPLERRPDVQSMKDGGSGPPPPQQHHQQYPQQGYQGQPPPQGYQGHQPPQGGYYQPQGNQYAMGGGGG